MPSAYAHLRFGWEVLSAIPTPYRAAAKNLTQLYNVGTQGPDPLFYYNPLVENAVDKQGHHCHAMTGKAFFEAALVRPLGRGRRLSLRRFGPLLPGLPLPSPDQCRHGGG